MHEKILKIIPMKICMLGKAIKLFHRFFTGSISWIIHGLFGDKNSLFRGQ